MNFYWVNHNQTFRIERGNNGEGSISGKLHCPKANKNGSVNYGYNLMQKIKAGDIIFSYAQKQLSNIGIAKSCAITTHPNTKDEGWEVSVDFRRKITPILKLNNLPSTILKALTKQHLPLQVTSNQYRGKQNCYLAILPLEVGERLLDHCNLTDVIELSRRTNDLKNIYDDDSKSDTEKSQLINARIGQGLFRNSVFEIFKECPVTNISISQVLRASHIKAWRDSTNKERLDPYNGIMLAAHIDALFDAGLISFSTEGKMLISSQLSKEDIDKLSVDTSKTLQLHQEHIKYIEYHNSHYFKK